MALDTYALVTLQNLKDWLGISVTTYDTILENLINATGYRIERYIGRQIMARDRIEFIDPDGSNTISLPQYPVNSIRYVGYGVQTVLTVSAASGSTDASATVQVQDDQITTVRNTAAGATNTTVSVTFASQPLTSGMATALSAVAGFTASSATTIPSRYLHPVGPIDVTDSPANLTGPVSTASGYRVEAATGLLHLPRFWRDDWAYDEGDTVGFGCTEQIVVVDYNAGYTTCPYDISQACLEIASAAYRARFKDANVDSETLGDYSYTSAVRDAANDLLDALLGSWREVR